MTALERECHSNWPACAMRTHVRVRTRSSWAGRATKYYPAELSGGEQQRVAVARALAPIKIVSPTSQPETGRGHRKQISELLFGGHNQRGTTLVLVTHDAALAPRCARVVRPRSGASMVGSAMN